ncbi:trithorax group protein osa-like [Amphibalanus amphitrite]|uniref:trithorax group protein osa-like n=1 Tax=Amphibalanus amphitrite TaxID=1232801 RepID=UPI001C928A3A|nr:trithorax group protein osa-like [Amphibalanus amphitrite]
MAATQAQTDGPPQIHANSNNVSEKEAAVAAFTNGSDDSGMGSSSNESFTPGKSITPPSNPISTVPLPGMVGQRPPFMSAGYPALVQHHPGYGPAPHHYPMAAAGRPNHLYPPQAYGPARGYPGAQWDPQHHPQQHPQQHQHPQQPPPTAPQQAAPPGQQSPQQPPPSSTPSQPSPAGGYPSAPGRPQQPPTPTRPASVSSEVGVGDSAGSDCAPGAGSQGPRPPPSPTSSAGSRSMSPAVGQQNIPMPPRPPSSQESAGGQRLAHSPHAYPPQAGPPPGAAAAAAAPPGLGHKPGYPVPHPQYGQPGGYPAQYNSHVMYGQYGRPGAPGQPPPGPPGHYPYQGQYPQQHWATGGHPRPGPGGKPLHMPGGGGPPGSAPPAPHYLRHHLQQKMAYGANGPSSGPNGPSAGPPPAAAAASQASSMPPPSSGPPPLAPPPRPASQCSDGSQHSQPASGGPPELSGPYNNHGPLPPIGPDGVPIDDASQHSTLSNTSANSEDRARSPKPRVKENAGSSHPPTPISGMASPGAASMTSAHDEAENNVASPGGPAWPRSPVSVYNPMPSRDAYPVSKNSRSVRQQKAESLNRLFEIDDAPGRREWVSRLLAFMEERGSPILQCPTVSKQPLDLFKLYQFTKERGGFVEVTKNKTWKEIAVLMGIGGSSSGAYTLRKHYMKNLIFFECHFDRGGLDPAPILAKYETKSNKKKGAASPGPQDSFSNSGSMDGFPSGYPGYPGGGDYSNGPSGQPPPQGASDRVSVSNPFEDGHYDSAYGSGYPAGYNSYPGHGYPPQPGYGHYPPTSGAPGQEYPPPPPGPPGAGPPPPPQQQPPGPPQQPPYMQYPNRSYPQPPTSAGQQPGGEHHRYQTGPPPGPATYGPRHMYPGHQPAPPPASVGSPAATPPPVYSSAGPTGPPPPPPPPVGSAPPASAPPGSGPGPTPATGPGGEPYPASTASQYPMASGVNFSSHLAKQLSAPLNPRSSPMTQMSPSKPDYAPAPTLAKQLAAPPLVPPQGPGGPTPMGHPPLRHPIPYGSGQHGAAPGMPAYRPGAPPSMASAPGQPGQRRPDGAPPPPPGAGPAAAPPYNQHQQYGGWRGGSYGQYGPPPAPGWNGNSPAAAAMAQPRMPMRPPYGKDSKPYPPGKPGMALGSMSKHNFPPDSVEATLPVMAKRRRGTRADVCPVDGWRLTMALRSGQLAESRWALDVLQILSFDDTSVSWLGLAHMPGLLAALLEHYRQTLAAMFARRATPVSVGWYEGGVAGAPLPPEEEPDLGVCGAADPDDRTAVLSGPDFTRTTRRGLPVTFDPCDDTILVSDRRRSWEVDVLSADCAWGHIETHIRVETGRLPLIRRLRDGKIAEDPAPQPAEKAESNEANSESKKSEPESTPDRPVVKTEPVEKAEADGDSKSEADTKDSKAALVNGEVIPGFSALDFFLSRLRKEAKSTAARKAAAANCDETSSATCENGDGGDAVAVKAEPMDATPDVKPPLVNGDASPSERGEQPETAESKSSAAESEEATSAPPPQLEIRDPDGTLKRKRPDDEEAECYQRDESSLYLTSTTQENIAQRCIAISTILRNLSFVPGNEAELATESLLLLLGDLLQLHHRHPARAAKHKNYDRDEDADFPEACTALNSDEWWSEYLPLLHENALVTLCNVSGQLHLGGHEEAVVRPLLDGLLHWLQCPSSYAADPFASCAGSPSLLTSPQRLALEALCRLCVHPENVDLMLATPPLSRLERICELMAQWVGRAEDQVKREMTLNLLYYFTAADERVARLVAMQSNFVPTLVRFVETAEHNAMNVASTQGVNALRDNPDLMGTSLDMLGRAANVLLSLARVPANRQVLVAREPQLLALVMSQILDQRVASVLSQVLFKISRPSPSEAAA